MADELKVHLDMVEQDPAIPAAGPDECPKCKVPYEVGFGLAGGGYGAYTSSRAKCDRCEGVGSYFRVPDGFNPFRAGGWATARAAYRVSCWRCCGTGHEPLRAYTP